MDLACKYLNNRFFSNTTKNLIFSQQLDDSTN